MVKLDLIADPTCPWSLIGRVLLEAAIEKAGHSPFTIEIHPFRLFPQLPPEGAERYAFLGERLGGRDGVARFDEEINALALALGLEINLSKITRQPNALNAMRLLHWAGLEGKQYDVFVALQTAYFRDGRDIGDTAVLGEIAEEEGMDKADILGLFETPTDAAEIRNRETHSRKMGIKQVPTFIVAEHHVVPGAQSAELWLNVIAELTGEPQPASDTRH